MLYLKTLSAVTQNELQAAGQRAMDLAFLHQQQIHMPASFIVLSTALDETVRLNNLKYKIDYILTHAQPEIASSMTNTYSGVRKALLEAKLPPGLETELREMYEQITAPLAIGELVAERPPVRVIMSANRLDDPESNDTIIQNVNSFEELLLALRESWALAYHPTALSVRLRERFPDNRLKIALIVQTMDQSPVSVHAYSSLPQDHKTIYLQVYNGYLDLRDRVIKDYYAISKNGLRIITNELREQTHILERNDAKELALAPLANGKDDKLNKNDLEEVARLTKKAERVLQTPVKVFFTAGETIELLWVNRLGFDVIIGEETSAQTVVTVTETVDPEQRSDDFILAAEQSSEQMPESSANPAPIQPISTPLEMTGVAAKLLNASLRIVRQVVERKYRSMFAETDSLGNISDMVNRLNDANAFSRPVDGALLLQAEEAARSESRISETDYAKTIEEVAFLMTYV
jgi:hypothetical protein